MTCIFGFASLQSRLCINTTLTDELAVERTFEPRFRNPVPSLWCIKPLVTHGIELGYLYKMLPVIYPLYSKSAAALCVLD